jgi:hypothetical protein
LETVYNEGESIAFVEFVLELDPMQSQGMQKALHDIHAKQNGKCSSSENREKKNHLK